jgi:hypothetical protein
MLTEARMNARALGHYPSTTAESVRWLVAGFVFGTLAVLIFHQGAFAILHATGFTPREPFPMQATAPLGIPQFWSLALWGGLWGVLLAAAVHRLERARLILAATLFGMVLPTLAAWFIVAAMKGQPLAAGFAPKAMAVGLIVNAAWGFGTGWGLAAFSGRRRTVL